jgi:hypothetical protein
MLNTVEFTLTKSAVMDFARCPYHYKRVYIDKQKQPETPLLLKGTVYHKARSEYLKKVDVSKLQNNINLDFDYIRSLFPDEDDIVYDNIAFVEANRFLNSCITCFKPVIIEKSYTTTFHDFSNEIDNRNNPVTSLSNLLTDEQVNYLITNYWISPIITFKGKIDDMYVEEDATYRINEFKTGHWNSGKATSMRKELILYSLIVQPHVYLPIESISYHFAYENYYNVEKIQKRSITALKDLIFKFIISTLDNKFESKYYKVTCDSNCQFAEECKLRKYNK